MNRREFFKVVSCGLASAAIPLVVVDLDDIRPKIGDVEWTTEWSAGKAAYIHCATIFVHGKTYATAVYDNADSLDESTRGRMHETLINYAMQEVC